MPQQINNITAGDIMARRLVTLKAEMDVFDAIDLIAKNKISGAPVIDEKQQLLGMFTEKSCLEVLVDAAYEGLPTNQVGAFMDEPADTVETDTNLFTMAQIFLHKKTRRLPVLDNGKLVGQVSRRDLIGAARQIVATSKDRTSTLLYLSALREMQDSPVS